MLESMTGFGKAIHEDNQQRIIIEIKSVNAKYADVNIQAPKLFNEYILSWRKEIIAHLQRGKIDVVIDYEMKQTAPQWFVNESLFKSYYQQLENLANEVMAPKNNLFKLALNSPGVVVQHAMPLVSNSLADIMLKTLKNAIIHCSQTRQQEGQFLRPKLIEYIQNINLGLECIGKIAPERIMQIKENISAKLRAFKEAAVLDESRLEQELVYYTERIDITEEQMRLLHHLSYFKEVMEKEAFTGKKLVFIAQEIGRELNTLGAKANHAAIQKYITAMKNELEKIKEQLLNIL